MEVVTEATMSCIKNTRHGWMDFGRLSSHWRTIYCIVAQKYRHESCLCSMEEYVSIESQKKFSMKKYFCPLNSSAQKRLNGRKDDALDTLQHVIEAYWAKSKAIHRLVGAKFYRNISRNSCFGNATSWDNSEEIPTETGRLPCLDKLISKRSHRFIAWSRT